MNENTAIMRRALDALDAATRGDPHGDVELEGLRLVWPGGAWSGPVTEGDWVYVLGNRRGFRRHWLIRTESGHVHPLPGDMELNREQVRALTDELERERPVTDP